MKGLCIGFFVLIAGTQFSSACSIEDVQHKATTLASLIQAQIHSRDDQKRIVSEWQRKAVLIRKEMASKISSTDISAACAIYDRLIAEEKKAKQ